MGEIQVLCEGKTLAEIDPRLVLATLEQDGLCLVQSNNPNPESDDLAAFVSLLGMPHEHNDCGTLVWDVRPCSDSPEAARSHTALAFPMHTDCSFEDPTPRYIALQVVRADSEGGGVNLLARVDDLLGKLAAEDHEVLKGDFTFAVPAEFHKGVNTRRLPILSGNSFRYRREILVDCTTEQLAVLDRVEAVLATPEVVARFFMPTGSVLFLDNHQFLHGRTAIRDPERYLRRIRFQPAGS